MSATLASIHIYPLKSGAPLMCDTAVVEPRGLAGDRRWMVVDADGKFLTARQYPRLTLIRAQPDGGGLVLEAPHMPILQLKVPGAGRRVVATVWKSTVQVLDADAQAQAWISAFLGLPSRLVFMDAACTRAVNPDYGQPGDEVSFADGFPLLLISQAALEQLNAKLAEPVPMLRFRPSIVVTGTQAHAEDGWKRIRVGCVEFDVVKPCSRCVFTTVDFTRGEFDPSGEPLRTLIRYRRAPNGVMFGQNLIPRGIGSLCVGDTVDVLT